jgi:hypothetical protein
VTKNELKEIIKILDSAFKDSLDYNQEDILLTIRQAIMNIPHKYLDYTSIKGEIEGISLFSKFSKNI